MKFNTTEMQMMIGSLGYFVDNIRTRPVETDTIQKRVCDVWINTDKVAARDGFEIVDLDMSDRGVIALAVSYTYTGPVADDLVKRLTTVSTDDVALVDEPFLDLKVTFHRDGEQVIRASVEMPDCVHHSAVGPTPGHALLELAIHMRNSEVLK